MLQRTNIYLPTELINFYKTQAAQQKSTMSDVVRQVLTKGAKEKKPNWAQSLLELAKRAPIPGSKITDLSKRHDYYLYIEPSERKPRQLRVRLKKKKRK